MKTNEISEFSNRRFFCLLLGCIVIFISSSVCSAETVLVMAENALYNLVPQSLDRYCQDLEDEGYEVILYLSYENEFESPPALKAELQEMWQEEAISGCLLIGDYPVAFYQMQGACGHWCKRSGSDYYYMDLNGDWEDLKTYDQNYQCQDPDMQGFLRDYYAGETRETEMGLYYYDSFKEQGTGQEGSMPEIWIGRLYPRNIAGDDIQEQADLLADYFAKNHAYRTGSDPEPPQALSYWDWPNCDDSYEGLEHMYSPENVNLRAEHKQGLVHLTYGAKSPTDNDYLDELISGYEFVYLKCHGGVDGNAFDCYSFSRCDTGDSFKFPATIFDSEDVLSCDHNCRFFRLFACSNCQYFNETNVNIACAYLFTGDGLLVSGITGHGGGYSPEHMFQKLGTGLNWGEAFLDWVEYHAIGGYLDFGRRWAFYEEALLGDPTLTVGMQYDQDGDELSDYREQRVYGTDPQDPDTDDDLMPDGWEVRYGLNPLLDDSAADQDGDGYSNLIEYFYSADPSDAFSMPSIIKDSGDYDGDGYSDLVIYRPSQAKWAVQNVDTECLPDGSRYFGSPGDMPVPGDYDGDDVTDIAVFRPSSGMWSYLQSSTTGCLQNTFYFGAAGDIPVPADYNGDGITDIAVFRPSNGLWAVKNFETQCLPDGSRYFGQIGDIPVPADYDGDGLTDLAVFRPDVGLWAYMKSSSAECETIRHYFGRAGDIPIPADYDGNGRTDIAVFRPTVGLWAAKDVDTDCLPNGRRYFGAGGDVPVPADYDGDAKADVAVFRPSTGLWAYTRSSLHDCNQVRLYFGTGGDIPLCAQSRIPFERQSLTAFWPMDECEGDTIFDAASHWNNGQIYGCRWVEREAGCSLSFNGFDDYVDCGADAGLQSETFTAVAWIYHHPTTESGDAVMGASRWDGHFTEGYVMRFWQSNHIFKYILGSESGAKSITASIPCDRWTQVAMTYDGAELQAFRDGISVGVKTADYTPPTQSLWVGRDHTNPHEIYFNGIIDDVRVYDRALMPEEIYELYTARKQVEWLGSDSTNNRWIRIEFQKPFPIIPNLLVSIITEAGGQTCVPDVRNLRYDGFEMRVDEPCGLDGYHAIEEINWTALNLPYDRAQMGTVETDNRWTTVNFAFPADGIPNLQASIITNNDDEPCHIDICNLSSLGFDVRVEESPECDGVHGVETISWLALDSPPNGSQMGNTTVRHNWKRVNFNAPFKETPVLHAAITTENGGDPCVVDIKNLTNNSFMVRVEETPGCDGPHTTETISWLAVQK